MDLAKPSLESVHVVLVETSEPLNIGSVARAMLNLGFQKLHLVSPAAYSRERAAVTACWADKLLDTVSLHTSLQSALLPMRQVVGFSAHATKARAEQVNLADWVTAFLEEPAYPVALVFGPEDCGLRQEHVEQCRWLVRLPASTEYESFNLAQAVLLALYELCRRVGASAASTMSHPRELPTWNEFQQLDRLVDQVARQCGFFHSGTPAPVPPLLKKLMRRMDPDEHEMRVLLGLFNRIEAVLSGRVPFRPSSGEPDS